MEVTEVILRLGLWDHGGHRGNPYTGVWDHGGHTGAGAIYRVISVGRVSSQQHLPASTSTTAHHYSLEPPYRAYRAL